MIDPDPRIDEEREPDQQQQDARRPDRIGPRGKEGDDARRHAEIIGITFLKAQRTGRVAAEALEDMRGEDRR